MTEYLFVRQDELAAQVALSLAGITGDVTFSGSVSAIGATKVTNAMLNADVFSNAHTWAAAQTFSAAITALTFNKLTLTQPAAGATLTLINGKTFTVNNTLNLSGTDGKTLTVNNSLTLAGTDATTITFQGTDTYVGRATTDTLTNKSISGATNTLSAIALASLATQTAFSLVGNTTSGAAVPTAFTIGGLTQKGTPAGTDLVLIQDQAASGALKFATITSIGSSAGVSSLNGQSGALINFFEPLGRVTISSGVPVMSSSVTNANSVYYTPYHGNIIPIYDGTNMIPTVFAEISQLTTDTTKSPAAVAASKIYDIFVWNDAGTLRATRGPAWTNSTTRGYTLTMTNGILLNTLAITNGPGALRGTWVGTIASNASSFIDYIFGGSASGGTAASLNVWNVYQRVSVATQVIDSGASYTYTSATIRQARGSAGNQIGFVLGAVEDGVAFSYTERVDTVSGVAGGAGFGIGFDSTTAFGSGKNSINTVGTAQQIASNTNAGIWTPGIGTHALSANENSDGSNANTFDTGGVASLTALLRL